MESKQKRRGPTGEGIFPYGLSYAAVPEGIHVKGQLLVYLRENSVQLDNMTPTWSKGLFVHSSKVPPYAFPANSEFV